jgi:hypothetical protein
MAKISSVSLPKLAPRRRLRHWPDGQVLGRQVSVVFAFASLHSVFDYFHPQLIVREKLGFIGMNSWCAGRLRYVRFPPHRDQ